MKNHAWRFRKDFERDAKLVNNKEQHIQTLPHMNGSITNFQLRAWRSIFTKRNLFTARSVMTFRFYLYLHELVSPPLSGSILSLSFNLFKQIVCSEQLSFV